MESKQTVTEIGNYLIYNNKKLGSGFFGSVFQASKKDKPEKELAVKQIQYDQSKIDSNKKLNTEIQIMKSVKSPFVVKFVSFKKTEKHVYIFMEKCNGDSLSGYISKNGGRLPMNTCVQFYKQLTEGFKALYNANIMHRDIKPDNILMHNGVCKIGDFGLGKILTDYDYNDTKTHTLCGSPNYMAPQLLEQYVKIVQFQNQQQLQQQQQQMFQFKLKYNPKCDVWSMGMVFYQMLIGLKAFQQNTKGSDIQNWLFNIYNNQLWFPEEVPSIIKDLISRMLTVNEDQRISWIELFEHELFVNTQEYERLSKDTNQINIGGSRTDVSEVSSQNSSNYDKIYTPKIGGEDNSQSKGGMSFEEDSTVIQPIFQQLQTAFFHFQTLINFNALFNAKKLYLNNGVFAQFMIVSVKHCIFYGEKTLMQISQQQQFMQQQQQMNNNPYFMNLLKAQKLIQTGKKKQIDFVTALVRSYDQNLPPEEKQSNFYQMYVNENFEYNEQLLQNLQGLFVQYINTILQYQKQPLNLMQQNKQYDADFLKLIISLIICRNTEQFLTQEYSSAQINDLDNIIYNTYQQKLSGIDTNYLADYISKQI